jgi:hypothetical protein
MILGLEESIGVWVTLTRLSFLGLYAARLTPRGYGRSDCSQTNALRKRASSGAPTEY